MKRWYQFLVSQKMKHQEAERSYKWNPDKVLCTYVVEHIPFHYFTDYIIVIFNIIYAMFHLISLRSIASRLECVFVTLCGFAFPRDVPFLFPETEISCPWLFIDGPNNHDKGTTVPSSWRSSIMLHCFVSQQILSVVLLK